MNNGVSRPIAEIGHIMLVIAICQSILLGSTTFLSSRGGQVLVANNEDNPNPVAYIWFQPGDAEKFGAVYFGFETDNPLGGMNEQKLYCSLADCPRQQVTNDPGKSTLFGNLIEHILETCAYLADVQDVIDTYNLFDLHEAQLLVADRRGNSFIIEGDQVIPRVGKTQIMSNFYQSNPELGAYPDVRFDTVQKELGGNISIDHFRRILSLTHQEGEVPTIYSTICNLKRGTVTLYHFHDYENPITFKLKDELQKEARTLTMEEFFGGQTIAKTAYDIFWRKADITRDLREYRVRTAAEKIWIWFQEEPGFSQYHEYEINGMGYQYLQADDVDAAIVIFELNTRMFPQSGNVWDSLGEGYMVKGEVELAIQNYEKSLEIDPDNSNAVNMLNRLREGE